MYTVPVLAGTLIAVMITAGIILGTFLDGGRKVVKNSLAGRSKFHLRKYCTVVVPYLAVHDTVISFVNKF